jgi:NADH-quinone oxidoreductase subunit M
MLLALLILFPLVAAIFVGFSKTQARVLAFGASVIEFGIFLASVVGFDPQGGVQHSFNYPWVEKLGINFHAGMDGISLLMVLLTTFLVPLIILSSFKHDYSKPGLFYALVLVMQSALVGVFTALDAFLFYVFWELALIPIYLICLMWGGKDRARITLKFFIYTLAGSLLMLVAIIYLYLQTPGQHTFDIEAFYNLHLDPVTQGWIFWAFFVAFAIKMPVFPFHTWQPDTYVTAPAPGTMLLSGIMLKMGIYGVIRWLLPVAPAGVSEWSSWAMALSVTGVVYASCIALVQKDFKRLLAYSSIAHVGLISAGIFSLTREGLNGSVIQMISHGVNVVGLFFIADIILSRMNTQQTDIGGVRLAAPKFATYFLVLVLASVALPLTNGFIGEFMLITGIFQYMPWVAGVAGLTIILGAVYMLVAYQNICLGTATVTAGSGGNTGIPVFSDLDRTEKMVLIPLVIMIFWIGIYPEPLLRLAGPSVDQIIQLIQASAGQ